MGSVLAVKYRKSMYEILGKLIDCWMFTPLKPTNAMKLVPNLKKNAF